LRGLGGTAVCKILFVATGYLKKVYHRQKQRKSIARMAIIYGEPGKQQKVIPD
jgi:hypothetical protein